MVVGLDNFSTVLLLNLNLKDVGHSPLEELPPVLECSKARVLKWRFELLAIWLLCLFSMHHPLIAVSACHLSSSRHASWLLHHHLLLTSCCTAHLSSHRAGWLLCCLSLRHPLVAASPLVILSLPRPLVISIVHCCHRCDPLPPSNANAHLCPLPPSNADTCHCHLPPLMSISIIILSLPIRSTHRHCRQKLLPPRHPQFDCCIQFESAVLTVFLLLIILLSAVIVITSFACPNTPLQPLKLVSMPDYDGVNNDDGSPLLPQQIKIISYVSFIATHVMSPKPHNDTLTRKKKY